MKSNENTAIYVFIHRLRFASGSCHNTILRWGEAKRQPTLAMHFIIQLTLRHHVLHLHVVQCQDVLHAQAAKCIVVWDSQP